MQITVHFLGSLRHSAGMSDTTLDLPDGATLAQAVEHLVRRFPALQGHERTWHLAVNQTYADDDTVLRSGDRLSIFPYIAGG